MPPIHLFRHRVNDVGVNIRVLHESDSGVINIFFHGYTAITDKKDIDLFKKQLTGFTNATNILVHWDSGNVSKSASGGASSGLLKVLTGGLNPLIIVGVALGGVLGGALQNIATSFAVSQENADKLAYNFDKLLELILENKHYRKINLNKKINLIGHSLGGRIIVNGLSWLERPLSYPIKKIMLMGAAVPWPAEGLPMLTNNSVILHNFYSSSDGALTIKTDLEKCIGKYGIPEEKQNITNFHCKGYGHTEYWPNLVRLFSLVSFDEMNSHCCEHCIIEKYSMRSVIFAQADQDLFLVLKNATVEELDPILEILYKKPITELQKEENNPYSITAEIQLHGGESSANIARGYGVTYAEILTDIAKLLNISLEEEFKILAEETALFMSNSVAKRLLSRINAPSKPKVEKRLRSLYELESAIVDAVLENCKKELGGVTEDELSERLKKILQSSGKNVSYTQSLPRILCGGTGMAGVAAASFLIPGVGLVLGAICVGAAALTTVATTLSSSAYSVVLPCVVMIHIIRQRQLEEIVNVK